MCILERVAGTNTEELENSKETHKFYAEIFDIWSITYCANANVI
jgi:hypothetical protein